LYYSISVVNYNVLYVSRKCNSRVRKYNSRAELCSRIEIMLKYFIQRDDTLVSWWIIHENAFNRIARSKSRKGSGPPEDVMAVGYPCQYSRRMLSVLNSSAPWTFKSSVRFLLSALMAIRSSIGLGSHLSSYMSINDSSLWYNISKEKIERLNFQDWRSLHLKWKPH